MVNPHTKRKFTRDALLVMVGLALATSFQGLNDWLKAVFYPSLFFPPNANLSTYDETQVLLFVVFLLFALGLIVVASRIED